MDNSVYITLSRQLALFRDMAATANNIANANTTGYGAERMMFNSYLMRDVNQGKPNNMAFANDISTFRDTSMGSLQSTGNPLDMAIEGEGYFMIETPLGPRYTRAGNFQIDGNGVLVTAAGYPVLDNASQRITLPDDTKEISVGTAGNLLINGQDFSTIGVVKFENPQMMEQLGNGLYSTDQSPQPNELARVINGTLENSNVKPVLELTHMMDVSRSVGNTARFVEVVYDLQRKAANTWAQQG